MNAAALSTTGIKAEKRIVNIDSVVISALERDKFKRVTKAVQKRSN